MDTAISNTDLLDDLREELHIIVGERKAELVPLLMRLIEGEILLIAGGGSS